MEQRGSAAPESGQAILEYVLLLTIVLGALTYFVQAISGKMDQTTAINGGSLEKQLRTGSAPASIWTK